MITIHNARAYHGPGIYVGRPQPRFPGGSVLANPFRLGVDGDRETVIAQYRRWLRQQGLLDGAVRAELQRLADLYRHTGRLDLICWCAPKACHANVIREAVLKISDAELSR